MSWWVSIVLIIVILLLISFLKGRGNAVEGIVIISESVIDCIEEVDFDLGMDD